MSVAMFAKSGSANLAYEVSGEHNSGTDVLLVHGAVSDRRGWSALVARLQAEHRCITYDQRGFGETVYEQETGWSPVGDALAVLDAVNSTHTVMIGSSSGGATAIDLALTFPERVAGLALIAPGVRGAPAVTLEAGSPELELDTALTDAEIKGDLDEVIRLSARLWLDGPAAAEGRVGGSARALFTEMERRIETAVEPGDQAPIKPAWRRVGTIRARTLILLGRLDARPVRVRGEALAQRIPLAKLRWLEGVAHLPELEANPAALTAISEFTAASRR